MPAGAASGRTFRSVSGSGRLLCPNCAPPNCGTSDKRNGPRTGRFQLFAKTELRDEIDVALLVFFAEIIQQGATLVDQHQQAATRMIVLRVGLEVAREIVDALGEDRDLDFRRTSVALALSMFADQRFLALCGN